MQNIRYRGLEIPYIGQDGFHKNVESGKWEEYTFDAIDRFGQDSSMLFDVGAWLGIFSYYYTAKFKKPAACFDCDPKSADYIKGIMDIWQQRKVDIGFYEIGIGSFCGKGRLNTQSFFGNSESSLQSRKNVIDYKLIDIVTFDFFTNAFNTDLKNSLIKVDIEGSEFDFLKGGSISLLQTNISKAIIIAFHPAWTPDMQSGIDFVIDNYFDVYNVECSVQPHVNISPEHFRAMLTNDIAHSFVFVRKD
jgi:FkbM family methyltransferase